MYENSLYMRPREVASFAGKNQGLNPGLLYCSAWAAEEQCPSLLPATVLPGDGARTDSLPAYPCHPGRAPLGPFAVSLLLKTVDRTNLSIS